MPNLKEIIENSKRICFFGGAGVSTESGIPDFRGSGGLYSREYGSLPPEQIVSHSFFTQNPLLFWQLYREKMIYPDARPNGAHRSLTQLEKRGILQAVVTQNIDGLHQAAGSRSVIELHGSVHRNYCTGCGKRFPLSWVIKSEGIPCCDQCSGSVRPDVVLYEEPLDEAVLEAAIRSISQADTLIIGGTSLVVYPAAGLIRYFSGDRLVVINKTPTGADRSATLVIHGSVAEALNAAVEP